MSAFTDGRIVLRPYRLEEASELAEAARESSAEVFPWLPWCHPEYSLEEARDWIRARRQCWAEGTDFAFAVRDTGDGRLLGGCGLNRIDALHRFANLGYWVRTGEAGRGIASAATALVGRFGLRHLALDRIEILAAVANGASQRVAEKAGAHREGVLRNRLWGHGRSHDAVMFSLVPDRRS